MTVLNDNDAAIRVTVDADGQVEFDFDFLIYAGSELVVVYKPGTADEETLTLGADFSVTGVGNQNGGTIDITASGIATVIGEEVLMYRTVPIQRTADYAIELRAASLNREQDRSIMIMQELRRDSDRALKTKIGVPGLVLDMTTDYTTGDPVDPGPAEGTPGDTLAITSAGVVGRGPSTTEIGNAQGYAEEAQEAAVLSAEALAAAQLLVANLQASIESITPHKLLFEGDGVTTNFLLGQSVSENTLNAFVSGVWQNSDTWSIVGTGAATELVFSEAPPAPTVGGTKNIEVQLGAVASVASAVVGPNSIGNAQLQVGAVLNDNVGAGALNLDRLAAAVQTLINTANQRAAKHYGNKATAEAATIDAATLYTRIRGRANPGDGGEAIYRRIGAAAIASGYPGFTSADGANWQFVPTEWKVRPEVFGAVGDGVTDDYAALQAAVDFIYDRGGGIVELGWDKKYGVSQTVELWQRVRLVGVGGYWLNQYAVGGGTPLGSTIFTLAGADCDAVQARMRLFNDGGTLKEVGFSRTNTDFRHHGGTHRVMYWGNRANNAAGCGFSVYGCRYVYVEQNAALECSEHGFEFIARNYTADFGVGGTIGSNNQRVFQNAGHNNDMSGFLIAMHDSLVCMNDAGNNLEDGFTGYFGQTCNDNAAWNNIERGFNLGTDAGYATTNATSATFSGNNAYDNELDGFMFSGNVAPVANGCYARANGRNTGAATTNRCNFKITSTVRSGGFVGCQSQAWDYDGVTPITYYGFLVSNPTYKIQFAGNHDRGSTVPKSVSTPANLIAPADVN